MPVLIPTSGGLESLSLLYDRREDFTPDYSSIPEPNFFWDLLPDDFESLSSRDVKLVESLWDIMLKAGASILGETAYLDQMSGLVDFPTRQQRRWVRHNLERTIQGSVHHRELGTLASAAPGSRTLWGGVSADETYIEGGRGGSNVVFAKLKGSHTSANTTRFEIDFKIRNPVNSEFVLVGELLQFVGEEEWVLLGLGTTEVNEGNKGLFIGISTTGRLAVAQTNASNSLIWVISSDTLPVSSLYSGITVSAWYTGITGSDPGYITAIATTSENIVASIGSAVTRLFTYDAVVITFPNTRTTHERIVFSRNASTLSVILGKMEFMDLSINTKTREIPSLQPNISNTDGKLFQDIDYYIDFTNDTASLCFQLQPPTLLWANYEGYDNRMLESIFGQLVGNVAAARGPDSWELKNRLFALIYGQVAGPHIGPLSTALSSIAGVPVCVEDGRVIALAGPTGKSAITVKGIRSSKVYTFNKNTEPTVKVGDFVRKFDTLGIPVVIKDWYKSTEDSGITGYGTLEIEFPYNGEGDPLQIIADSKEYLRLTLPMWVSVNNVITKLVTRADDSIDLSDALNLHITGTMRDTLTDGLDPRYNDGREFEYSNSNINYDEADQYILKERLIVSLNNTSALILPVTVFEVDIDIPANSTLIAAEYEDPPTTPWP